MRLCMTDDTTSTGALWVIGNIASMDTHCKDMVVLLLKKGPLCISPDTCASSNDINKKCNKNTKHYLQHLNITVL